MQSTIIWTMKDIHCWHTKYEPCYYSDRLLGKLSELNNSTSEQVDITEVKKAIFYAKKYHGNQRRKSGEPYYSHPLEVAYMAADYLFKTDVIVASILHDTVEDTDLTAGMILDIFGRRIQVMVDRLTRDRPDGSKLSIEEILNNAYQYGDTEVIIIKLIDRLHNIYTLDSISADKQHKTLSETLDNFIIPAIYYECNNIEKQILQIYCNYKAINFNLLCFQDSTFNIDTPVVLSQVYRNAKSPM